MPQRKFIQVIAAIFFAMLIALAIFIVVNREKAKQEESNAANLKLASYFETLDNNYVRCNLCPNHCVLASGQIGLCKARKNIAGKLYSLAYGKLAAIHIDPIEKKPLYHFLPGTSAFSIAAPGCNLACKFCQNWSISQKFIDEVETKNMTPREVVEEVLKSGSKSIAYTYTEPVVFFEFMLETAKLAKENGLKNVIHSNGYINQEPLLELVPYLDAANIDLKGINDKFYKTYTQNGRVEPVLETLKTLKQHGVWVEVTNLLIPSANDNSKEIEKLAVWVKENLGAETPLHFSRFFPMYKLENLIPTPAETLVSAYEIAKKAGLKYVYMGNVDLTDGGTTYCPDGKVAIRRLGYFISENNLTAGLCSNGEKIEGVWE